MTGFNVIGYTSANFGLGIAARNTVRLLTGKRYEVAVADLNLNDGRSGRDHTFDHLAVADGATLPNAVNILHVNPPIVGRLLGNSPAWLNPNAGLNVAVPFWELPVLPRFWIADLQAVDVVLAPSHFVEQAVANAFSGRSPLVRHYPQTAFLPDRHGPDRPRFGLPEQAVLFSMSFEIASDISRKNPWAVIEAFNGVFTDTDAAYLVIKLNASYRSQAFEQQRARLQAHAAANPRIIIRDEPLSYGEVISLYESCDVYVSLHRSEGLGLGALEAMLLGKPVIATAWSGNMDYMDDVNSCMVSYRLVPVESPVYRGLIGDMQVVWADPLVPQAAAWMRRLYDNAELRRAIGERAREEMLARHAACLKAKPFTMVEEIFALRKAGNAWAGSGGAVEGAAGDPGELFSGVSALLKENKPAAAIELYDRDRRLLPETEVVRRFDELMRQLREKA
jgi:glycosyltransferase involved in cell wall biosynthesis